MDSHVSSRQVDVAQFLERPADHFGQHPWYAIRTRSNHEKITAMGLKGKGYEPYLPTYHVHRRRAERIIKSDHPLFPGYVFCCFDVKKRLPILITTGVVSIVGFGGEPAPIPDHEIEAVRAALRSGLPSEPCPYLREGQRIRVMGGSLEGVEGILLKKKNQLRMVISVSMLQRSISVEIDHDQIVAI
jgi:transcription antitermination factor NusG